MAIKSKKISISLPIAMLREVDKLAIDLNSSRSYAIKTLIKKGFKNEETRKGGK